MLLIWVEILVKEIHSESDDQYYGGPLPCGPIWHLIDDRLYPRLFPIYYTYDYPRMAQVVDVEGKQLNNFVCGNKEHKNKE